MATPDTQLGHSHVGDCFVALMALITTCLVAPRRSSSRSNGFEEWYDNVEQGLCSNRSLKDGNAFYRSRMAELDTVQSLLRFEIGSLAEMARRC